MACVLGDDGVDIEGEGGLDILVGSAERDAEVLEESPYAKEFECVAAEAIGANDPDLAEMTSMRITDERATTRSLLQRDGSRDAVILVMLEDQNTRFGRETAVEGGALVADGMAVTLLVGGDAGVGGYGAGVGQDDLQRKGKRSGMYERSEGA